MCQVYIHFPMLLQENQLEKLPDRMYELLPNLEQLHMASNNMAALPDDIALHAGLTLIDLSRNRLERFPRALVNMAQLRTLDISHNMVDNFPDDMDQLVNLGRIVHLLCWTRQSFFLIFL